MQFKLRFIALTVLFALSFDQLAHAAHLPAKLAQMQQPTGAPQSGPIPAQIATARTIYLANGGADDGFPATPDESYADVATALRQWGHYQLADSPNDADLIFQLHEVSPTISPAGPGAVPLLTYPAFQIAIIDPHTNLPIWTVTSPVLLGSSNRQRNRWFQVSVNNLVSRLKVVAGEPLTSAETKQLTQVPKGNYLPLYLAGGLMLAGIGTGFLMKHEFDKTVDAQNAALCKQNPFFCNQP